VVTSGTVKDDVHDVTTQVNTMIINGARDNTQPVVVHPCGVRSRRVEPAHPAGFPLGVILPERRRPGHRPASRPEPDQTRRRGRKPLCPLRSRRPDPSGTPDDPGDRVAGSSPSPGDFLIPAVRVTPSRSPRQALSGKRSNIEDTTVTAIPLVLVVEGGTGDGPRGSPAPPVPPAEGPPTNRRWATREPAPRACDRPRSDSCCRAPEMPTMGGHGIQFAVRRQDR
jgi:hypothetical protein